MRRPRGTRREILGCVLSLVVAAGGASEIVGRPARTVDVLTVFAGGVGVGSSVALAVARWRAKRQTQVTAP
jgi:hypothetical protein